MCQFDLPSPSVSSSSSSPGILPSAWRVSTSLSGPVRPVLALGDARRTVGRSGGPRCCWWTTSVCCWVWGWAPAPRWTSATTAEPPSAPSYRSAFTVIVPPSVVVICFLNVTLISAAGQRGDAGALWWAEGGGGGRRRWRLREASEGPDPPVQPHSSGTGSPHRLLQGHTRPGEWDSGRACMFSHFRPWSKDAAHSRGRCRHERLIPSVDFFSSFFKA